MARAIQGYEKDHGELPPAYVADADGKPLHSWRTLLLPYLECKPLYDLIDFTKAWDDPVNSEAREAFIEIYACPSYEGEPGKTTYLAVSGPECAFNGATPRKRSEFKRGGENTIMLVEVDAEHAVHWMSPEDASPELVVSLVGSTTMPHEGIVNAASASGDVGCLTEDIDDDSLRAMLTTAGGDREFP